MQLKYIHYKCVPQRPWNSYTLGRKYILSEANAQTWKLVNPLDSIILTLASHLFRFLSSLCWLIRLSPGEWIKHECFLSYFLSLLFGYQVCLFMHVCYLWCKDFILSICIYPLWNPMVGSSSIGARSWSLVFGISDCINYDCLASSSQTC